MTTVEEFIEHYGIKGMRWGVRRKPGPNGRVGGKKSGDEGSDSGKSESGGSKSGSSGKAESAKNLSDKELREKINRIQMERKYSELTASPTKSSAAREFAADIAKNVAKQQVTNLMNKQAEAFIGGVLSARAKNPAADIDTAELAKVVRRKELEKRYNAVV